jgi:hypothetical protein
MVGCLEESAVDVTQVSVRSKLLGSGWISRLIIRSIHPQPEAVSRSQNLDATNKYIEMYVCYWSSKNLKLLPGGKRTPQPHS